MNNRQPPFDPGVSDQDSKDFFWPTPMEMDNWDLLLLDADPMNKDEQPFFYWVIKDWTIKGLTLALGFSPIYPADQKVGSILHILVKFQNHIWNKAFRVPRFSLYPLIRWVLRKLGR